MGLIDQVKKSLQAKEQIEIKDDNEEKIKEDFFVFYDKKWILSPFMEEIKGGDMTRVPIECMLTHYILRSDNNCIYISLSNNETGDEYGVWEFDWIGWDGEEKIEPEFREVSLGMGAVDCARFLKTRLEIGYDIFIEERVEVEDLKK